MSDRKAYWAAYHARRWAADPEYRARKRAHARAAWERDKADPVALAERRAANRARMRRYRGSAGAEARP